MEMRTWIRFPFFRHTHLRACRVLLMMPLYASYVVSGVNITNAWEFSLKSRLQPCLGCYLWLWAINDMMRIRSWSWMSLSFWKEQHFSMKTWLGSGFSCCWNRCCGCVCVHIYMKRCVKNKGNREKKIRVFHFSENGLGEVQISERGALCASKVKLLLGSR